MFLEIVGLSYIQHYGFPWEFLGFTASDDSTEKQEKEKEKPE